MTALDAGPASTRVKSAERAIAVLELLASAWEPLTAGAIAERIGIPRSSLHGLLHTLLAVRWLEEDTGRFSIGPRALVVGFSYIEHDGAVARAWPMLEQLRDTLSCTANYARLVDDRMVYLQTRESATRRSLPSRLGRSVPAHPTALGRILLSEQSDSEVESYLDRAGAGRGERAEVWAEIGRTRARGFAVEEGQSLPDIACVAIAVPYRIPATDAVSCSYPMEQCTPDRVAEIAGALRREVDAFAKTLRAEGVR